MTGEWHWLGVISLMVERCPMKETSNGQALLVFPRNHVYVLTMT